MLDFEKFSRYSRPGPRYTSYPTAVEFHEGFGASAYLERLKKQDSSRLLSLYVHLPFCRSACYFCGCNVVYTSKEENKRRYLDYLKKELEILTRHLDTSREVIQLHLGGGTPTFHSPEEIEELFGLLRATFPNFSNQAEISCEIDPRYFTPRHMEVLAKGGTNRLSFGVQDFDPRVQQAIHRVQSFDLVRSAVEMARQNGVGSINFDLIYGLPFQTFESFESTLDSVISLHPERLAVFNYAHVPWMKKTMRKIDETTLPSPEVKLRTLKMSIDKLTGTGYQMIGMDHFAKPEDELFLAIKKGELHRNFQGYTTKGGADMVGIGLTSIGEGENYYVQNFKTLPEYEAAIDSGNLPAFRGIALNEDDRIRKALIMELMSNFKLDIPRFSERFKIDFHSYFADDLPGLDEFQEAGLLERDEKKITILPTGTLLIRNIVMPFDAHLKQTPETARRFSKTV